MMASYLRSRLGYWAIVSVTLVLVGACDRDNDR